MNTLVQEMLNTVAGQDTELVFLEGLLEEECTCEANEHGGLDCQKSVSALYLNCKYQQRVCATRVTYLESYIELHGMNYCKFCLKTGKDCWTIRPI